MSPGIPCPDCHNFIEFSIDQLLRGAGFVCGHCKLRVSLDQDSAEKAANAIQVYEQIARQNLMGE